MSFLDYIHECSHDALEWVALTSSSFLHVILHIVIYGTPLLTSLLILTFGFFLYKKARARRKLTATPHEILDRAHAVGLIDGIFKLILRRTRSRQIVLLLGAAAAMPTLYLTLEIPKHIINHAIGAGQKIIEMEGVKFSQVEFLVALCILYLTSLLINGSIKYWLNVYQGRVGELLIRRLRLMVYRGWRHNGQPGGRSQLIPIIVQEVEPIGGFAGEAFVTPVFQGGTFLTILAFMLVQNPVLGAAALLMLPIQLTMIPPLQRKINALNRTRVREVRHLGGLIGDAEPHARPSLIELRLIQSSIRIIQEVRFNIFRNKYMMKSAINFLNNLVPFFFYLIGGYFVIEGKVSFGALVAVLAAHKDFSTPLRELLMYYQVTQDVRVRYREVQRFVAGVLVQHLRRHEAEVSSDGGPTSATASPLLSTT
jgi:ABC-type multidrug transport system fused ATPase/permease subunit